jgi:hypothetical protein
LKARHIAIEIHPVDAFHFQHDMATDLFNDNYSDRLTTITLAG